MKGLIGLKTLIIIASSLVVFSSCQFISKDIAPELHYVINDHQLKNLPSPFPPLSKEEKQTPWGIEYQIAKSFAKNLDLYRAITAFKRSSILSPDNHNRKLEIDYQILLSYYFAKRYKEIEQIMEDSPLAQADESFPAFDDLLVILFDTQWNLGREENACRLLEFIETRNKKIYQSLLIGSLLREGNSEKLSSLNIKELEIYTSLQKSSKKAAIFSALLPGSGYFYIGQTQTAITGFLLNILFIASIVSFFKRRLIALGIIFLSLEVGWYGGGIYGAAGQANLYNQRTFEEIVTPIMNKSGYFPIHQLRYAF